MKKEVRNLMLRMLKYILCVLVALFAFATISTGDVGDFNDYDSDSSWSDSSSGSWSSGSSNWDSAHTGSSSKNTPFVALFFFTIWFIVFLKQAIKIAFGPARQTSTSRPLLKWSEIPDHTTDIARVLQETDPAFNGVAFLEWAKEVFFKLQYAWMDRDWEHVRPFESEELYATHERQLQEYKRLGRINILERINVNNAYFFQLIKDQEWEALWVVMNVRMVDYIVDEHTRKVLKGTPDKDCFMSYFYVFKRKAGVKTLSAKQGVDNIACPNCGAPTHVVSSGKCEYCNFVITVKDHGWVLTDIVGIKPPYDYGAGGVIIQDKPEE